MEKLDEEMSNPKMRKCTSSKKFILLERFSLSCAVLPYYGFIQNCKILMTHLSSKSRILWNGNITAFEKLTNQQDITVFDCEDKLFTEELSDEIYCINWENTTDERFRAYPTRIIDSYYIQLKIQSKIECMLLIQLIKEIRMIRQSCHLYKQIIINIGIKHTIIFESITIENIDTYSDQFNSLYSLLKHLNVEDSKIYATFGENPEPRNEVVEYISSCANTQLLSRTKVCRTLEINENTVKKNEIICNRISLRPEEYDEINAELIRDHIPLKSKSGQEEDVEDINEDIEEIAITFNNEQELLIPKIKINELKELLPRLKKLDITEQYFIDESFTTCMKLDCGLEIDYKTELTHECIYIFLKNSILIFKDPLDGSTNVIAYDQLNIRCQYCVCPCDLFLKKKSSSNAKDKKNSINYWSESTFVVINSIKRIEIRNKRIVRPVDCSEYHVSTFFEDSQKYLDNQNNFCLILPNKFDKFGYVSLLNTHFTERIRCRKIGFCVQGLSDVVLAKIMKEFENQPKDVEIFLLSFSLEDFQNVLKLCRFFNRKNLTFFGMIPDDISQSEISALKLLLIELDSKNLQLCLIGGSDK